MSRNAADPRDGCRPRKGQPSADSQLGDDQVANALAREMIVCIGPLAET